MAAHRYWRLHATDSENSFYVSLSELQMRTTTGGADIATTGFAIDGGDATGDGAVGAFDGSTSSFWGYNLENPLVNSWVGQDFGSGNDQDIVEIAVTSRNHVSNHRQTPSDFTFEYSDDGVTWTAILSVVDEPDWTANETRVYEIAEPAAPSNDTPPTVSGDSYLGATITTTDGAWSGNPDPVLTYTWYRNGVVIPGETGTTYTTKLIDEGAVITSQVTATNDLGSVSEFSSNSVTIVSLPDGDTVNNSPGQSFMLTSRLEIPFGTLEPIVFSGQSGETYGGFIAAYDMVLRRATMHVRREEGLRHETELFVRVNNGTPVSLGSKPAGWTGGDVFEDVNVSISQGDDVEILFTCGNNYNMSVGVAFFFETEDVETSTPFLLTGFFEPVGWENRHIIWGGNSYNYYTNIICPTYMVVEAISYYSDDGVLLQDHTLSVAVGEDVTVVGTIPAGEKGGVIDGLSVEVPLGALFSVYAVQPDNTGASNQDTTAVIRCRTAAGNPYSDNIAMLVWGDTDLELPQTVAHFTIPADCKVTGVSFSSISTVSRSGTLTMVINDGTPIVLFDYDFPGPAIEGASVNIDLLSGDLVEVKHSGTGVTGLGGVTALTLYMPGDEAPAPPEDPTEWPEELPPGSIAGSAAVQANKTAFQPEYGPSIDRRKGSSARMTVSITLPPLTAAEYEIFKEFFYVTLKNGSIPMTYPDPISKENRRFQFKQNRPVIREKAAPGGRIEISFEAIRID